MVISYKRILTTDLISTLGGAGLILSGLLMSLPMLFFGPLIYKATA